MDRFSRPHEISVGLDNLSAQFLRKVNKQILVNQ